MNKHMTQLLMNAIRQIDNLYDYYLAQEAFLKKHVNQKLKKYKYGLLLHKFFVTKTDQNTSFTLAKEDEETLAAMIEDYSIIKNEDGSISRISYRLKDSFKVDERYELDPNKTRMEIVSLYQRPSILSNSVLMMLLVKYEESIANIYRFLIEKHPEAFLSDKSITYSELMKQKLSLDEILEKFITKEIDGIMREPISDWYDSFRKKQKAQFLFADDLFERFKEVYYRRNLIVHNQGVVNEIYLSNTKNNEVKIGERLKVDKKYLENAFQLTRLMLIDTFLGLRKIADDKEQLISWISSYGYDCLIEKQWEQAKYIYKVILQDDNMKSIDKLIAKINYWISIKNLKGVAAIQKEVNLLDVSSMRLEFSVAKAALLNEHKEVSYLLEECLEKDEIPAYYIKTWPLLNEYRASDEYTSFVEKHREELDGGEYEASTDDDILLEEETDERE